MRRIKSNFHELHVLRNEKTKLRKAILSNCNKELINTISECVLNVLIGNLKLTDCQRRRLQKFRGQLRSVAGRRVALATKKRLINQRGGFLVPLLSAIQPTVASLIFRSRDS
jgi:hypothetical protein